MTILEYWFLFKNTEILQVFILIPGVGIWGCFRLTTAADCALPRALAEACIVLSAAGGVWDCVALGILKLFREYINARPPRGKAGGCSRGLVAVC